jgi:hypothetical protein
MEVIMKLLKVTIVVASFLGLAVSGVWGMDVNPKLMEEICRVGQRLRLQMRSAKESDKAPISEGLSLCKAFWSFLVNRTLSCGGMHCSVSHFLPSGKEIKDLSDLQKDALVMFGLQLDKKGKLTITSPYLLAGAINTLDNDRENPVSAFILEKIIKQTPDDFLQDSDFSN